MTASQIAAIFGWTRNRVVGLCHRNKIHLQGNDRKARQARAPRAVYIESPAPRAAGRPVDGGCRFIAGDPHARPVLYCGEPVAYAGTVWCAEHRAIVYNREPLKPLL